MVFQENKYNIKKEHYEIAGALQRSFTEIVFHLLDITKKKGSRSNKIVIAGGAAMNCVTNGLLDKNKIYDQILYHLPR